MELQEMSRQYADTAAVYGARISEINNKIQSGNPTPQEAYILRRELSILLDEQRELSKTARRLAPRQNKTETKTDEAAEVKMEAEAPAAPKEKKARNSRSAPKPKCKRQKAVKVELNDAVSQSGNEFENPTEYEVLRKLMKGVTDDKVQQGGMQRRIVATAIKESLTARQAQIVQMYFVEQRTMKDIADTLGVNTSTVSRTVTAAKKKLRRCLSYGAFMLFGGEAS